MKSRSSPRVLFALLSSWIVALCVINRSILCLKVSLMRGGRHGDLHNVCFDEIRLCCKWKLCYVEPIGLEYFWGAKLVAGARSFVKLISGDSKGTFLLLSFLMRSYI